MMARIALGSSLLLALVFSALLWQQWGQQFQQHYQQQQALRLIDSNIQNAWQQAETLKRVAAPFADLTRRGLIGTEDRLNWLEVMQESIVTHSIPDVKYQIDPRQTDSSIPISDPRLQLHKTPVALDMQLLHIGDLIFLLSDLQTKSNGNFRIESCEVSRQETSNKGNINLAAKCQLSSYTLLLDAPQDVVQEDAV